MWAIRVLSGEQSGQILPLKAGKNIIGRSPQCDIKLKSNGVSKRHIEVSVYDKKILITDLNSSNGTYVNGARIQNSMIRMGDRIALNEVIIDIVPLSSEMVQYIQNVKLGLISPQGHGHQSAPPQNFHPPQGASVNAPIYDGNNALHQEMHIQGDVDNPEPNSIKNLLKNIQSYMERVALPGVYKLPQLTEFRYVMGGFVGLFILMVTLLSMIPMLQITKSSIQQESRRRALTIARNLATVNQSALIQDIESALSTQAADLEEGVSTALLIAHRDGSILAPASKAGNSVDLPFVHTVRREKKEIVVQISDATIGASVPISYFNSETGTYKVKAHAIVLYDMGSLAVDDGRSISLFFQTLAIAFLLGALIFYFMFKLIEHPLASLNGHLDLAMKEGNDNIEIPFRFPVFQGLVSNINSLLTRALYGDSGNVEVTSHREREAQNLLHLIGYPAMAINESGLIVTSNTAFEEIMGISSIEIQNQTIDIFPDAAFQKNVITLIDRCRDHTDQIASDTLDFGGDDFTINCQVMLNSSSDPEYFIITISQPYDADEGESE